MRRQDNHTWQFVKVWMVMIVVSMGLALLLPLTPAGADTYVSGTINVDTTWTLSNSPYIVTDDVYVEGGTTPVLTIQPGVTVKFNAGKGLYIGYYSNAGALVAAGTSASRITFTSSATTPAAGQWKGVYFGQYTDSATTQFTYCTVEYGGFSNNANVYVTNTNSGGPLTLQANTIRYSSAYGVYCTYNSKAIISQNSFTNNGSYPLRVLPEMQVSGNTFASNTKQAIEVEGGYVRVNTTWKKEPVPYVIAGQVCVESNGSSTLTIEPGVTVKFNAGTGLDIGYSYTGALVAAGTAALPITFTSNATTPAAGQWKGVHFGQYTDSATTQFTYCTVEYGGNYYNANVYVENTNSGGPLTLQANTIRYSSAYGVYCTYNSKAIISQNAFTNNGSYPLRVLPEMQVSGNTFASNTKQAIEVEGGYVRVNTTWKKEPVPYVIAGQVCVEAGGSPTLTIEPGVTVKFNAGFGLDIGYSYTGALVAAGTAALPITFTSNATTPAAGQWKGVHFGQYTDSATTQFTYCIVEYGGNYYNANVYVENTNSGGPLTLQANTIRYSSAYGVYCTYNSKAIISQNTFTNNGSYPLRVLPVMQVSGNTFASNTKQAIEVADGYVGVNTTWKKEPVPYVIAGDITVQADASPTLTIEPGVTVKFNTGFGLYIGYSYAGALIAAGTAALPITFTSNATTPAAGQWDGVYFGGNTDSATTQFTYCTVEYGGLSNNANVYIYGVNLTIEACTLRKSSQSGLRIYGTGSNGAQIKCNRFENNLYGVYTESSAQPLINNNDFVTNTNYGVYNASAVFVNAQQNWWNAAGGPNTTGDRTYGNVTSTPFLAAPSQFCSAAEQSFILWTK